MPTPRQQAGLDRPPARGNQRHLPAVPLQVPRLGLRARRQVLLRAAGGRVLRTRQGRLRPGVRALRGVVGVHLREPREGAEPVAARVPRPDDHGDRLPVPQHDGALLLPRRHPQQLEGFPRRLPGVLSRADLARSTEPGDVAARIPGSRLLGSAFPDRWTAPPGLDDHRPQLAAAAGDAEPDRARDAQRLVRPLGSGGHRDRWTRARHQPGQEEGLGPRLVPGLPELRVHYLGAGLVPHLSLLADGVRPAPVRGEPLLRPGPQRAGKARARAGRGDHQGVRASGLWNARSDPAGARVRRRDALPAGRPGDPVPAPEQGGLRLGLRVPARARRGASMSGPLLPPEFSDLEPFARDWCLASEPERYAKRLASSMDEMQAFYDALFPRAEEAIAYCEKFPLHDLPAEVQRLLQLLYSLIMVSFPVEIWRQPYIPDTGTSSFELEEEPVP